MPQVGDYSDLNYISRPHQKSAPEKFENGFLTLNKHQLMLSIYITPDKFENATVIGHFGSVFDEKLIQLS